MSCRTHHRAGVTLVEILISVSLGIVIATLVSFATFDYYKSYQYQREEALLIALLQKTRSRAMSNIAELDHGLHLDIINREYIVFRGSTYSSADPTNEVYEYSSGIAVSTSPVVSDILFTRLTGATTPVTVMVGDGLRSTTLTINAEGGMSW